MRRQPPRTTQEFSASAQEHLLSCGVKAFVAFPVFLSDKYWGFLSFDNCHSESLCSQQEATILQSGSLLLANAVERDVMEKERAAALEQAIQASRAKGDFLSNMSHEMRTPMNAIIGMTSIGISSHNVEGKDNAFKKIDDASKHLLGVINDILDMSKIEADKLELSPISFNFEKMLQNVVNVINFRVDERHQQFYIMIDKHIPHMLIGDDQRLAQVVTNLLSNAVKFTPEEGSIHLDANLLSEEDGQCRVRIDVTDTGIGISEEQKHRLFQSFEQAEAGTSRKFGGTGLGLAISKRIVELMGGEIWVESEQGHGAKFSFTVQLQRDSQSYKRLLADDINWGNIRIFAVDDEPEIREFFLSVSENLGIVCNVAASGEEAAEMLAAHNNYNVYFLDWKLPGMTGIDLARQINANSINKSVVIIFSSTDWSVIEDDARAAGVDKFLPKPLFPSVIVDLINECLGLGYIANEPVKSDDDSLDFSRYTLLLAEDVEINREIVMALFEPTMLTIDCAENGREAVDMFCAAPDKYDMIFMDVQMPEMDGYEATRFIRALDMPVAKTIPIVAMTANVFREDVERCLEAGMNDHVGKPLDFDVILEKLRMYLPK
jgi:signal transduction histidine kinase/DNA-binding response OmpR family regulator